MKKLTFIALCFLSIQLVFADDFRFIDFIPTTTSGSSFPTTGLVAKYNFDEGSGVLKDVSGNNCDGVWSGNGTHYVSNGSGKYYGQFNGTNDKITISTSSAFNFGTGAWSMTFKIMYVPGIDAGCVMNKATSGWNNLMVFNASNQTVPVYPNGVNCYASMTNNVTYYYTITCDASGNRKLYVNGSNVLNIQINNINMNTNSDVTIGYCPVVATWWWKGTMDNIAFWNVELTPTQVAIVASDTNW